MPPPSRALRFKRRDKPWPPFTNAMSSRTSKSPGARIRTISATPTIPGCFRCHDEAHLTADKKTIAQDCNACHQPVAMDEASPDILKTLELTPTQNH